VTQRLAATGVRFTISGENVARAENADEAHHGLMGSPGHRANILGADYTAVGIGVVQQGDSIYVTQDFVHKVPAYSDEQFISAVQESMNRLRKAKNIHPLVVITDPQLHQTACSTNGDAQSASAGATGVHEVFVFTLSEPAALPPRITEQASSAQTQRMKLGVCFRPDNKYGYGNFWVVAEF
ncbi:MAG TPA: CAP domain-containing protein, partial [Alphaproteobacteria bacterium]|nr:CAP domain-containing protein [Alphaproteobacteria bacterium]